MAAGTKLVPGESSCTNSEVASVSRVQLGCDQFHCEEAGDTTPSLTAFYFVTLCSFYGKFRWLCSSPLPALSGF
uniref:Uncharacterized protein n=1 Tax=Arundo donax TaxID=35708 RepID=A0A0A9HX15_ARUDO